MHPQQQNMYVTSVLQNPLTMSVFSIETRAALHLARNLVSYMGPVYEVLLKGLQYKFANSNSLVSHVCKQVLLVCHLVFAGST